MPVPHGTGIGRRWRVLALIVAFFAAGVPVQPASTPSNRPAGYAAAAFTSAEQPYTFTGAVQLPSSATFDFDAGGQLAAERVVAAAVAAFCPRWATFDHRLLGQLTAHRIDWDADNRLPAPCSDHESRGAIRHDLPMKPFFCAAFPATRPVLLASLAIKEAPDALRHLLILGVLGLQILQGLRF
jgi:hypothetical protein